MTWHAIDLIQPTIDQTKSFFSGPGLMTKWIKIGFLIFVFSMLSGGGGSNFNFNSFNNLGDAMRWEEMETPGFENIKTSIDETIAGVPLGTIDKINFSNFVGDDKETKMLGSEDIDTSLKANIEEAIANIPQETVDGAILIIIVAVIVLFLIGIVLTMIKNIVFFTILEGITTNRVKVLGYVGKFYDKAVSLTILEIIMGLISLPFGLILAFVGISLFMTLTGFDLSILGPFAGLASNIPALIGLAGLSIIVFIIMGLVGFVLGQFGVYWMYLSKMSAWDSLKKSVSLVTGNLGQVAILIIMQVVLGLVVGIIALIAVLIMLIPFAIVGIIGALILIPLAAGGNAAVLIIAIGLLIIGIFIFSLIAAIVLAPLSVFFFYYNLNFLKKILPSRVEGITRIR